VVLDGEASRLFFPFQKSFEKDVFVYFQQKKGICCKKEFTCNIYFLLLIVFISVCKGFVTCKDGGYSSRAFLCQNYNISMLVPL
jgi:hypothetical protein